MEQQFITAARGASCFMHAASFGAFINEPGRTRLLETTDCAWPTAARVCVGGCRQYERAQMRELSKRNRVSKVKNIKKIEGSEGCACVVSAVVTSPLCPPPFIPADGLIT